MTRDSTSPFGALSYRTTDAGQTWQKQEPLGLGYGEIFYHPGGPVYLLSFGRLHISRDRGQNWETVSTGDGLVARSISIHGKTGIMAGPSGLLAYSSDSGLTWTKPEQWSNKLYISSVLIDEKIGYAGGMDGEMIRTTNGGIDWKQELLVKSFNILDMCLAGDYLYAVGGEGGIIAKKVK